MKSRFVLLVLSFAITCVIVIARQEPIKPKVVSINPNLINTYTEAQKRTETARQLMENTPQWKDFIIRQNQEQTVLFAIMGELGIKPLSDECVPIFLFKGKRTLEDGTLVNSSNGVLDHFECPVKDKPKSNFFQKKTEKKNAE
jgi:hypothetical protein